LAKLIDRVRLLLRQDGAINTGEGCSEREIVRALKMLLHDSEEIVRQRACRELGKFIAAMPPEKFDNYIRRLLWRLNPESGDNPVAVPELLGEIGARAPGRIESFVPPIMSHFKDENLRPGLLQAAGRIGEKKPEALFSYIDEIATLLHDGRPVVAGGAALALCRIGGAQAEEALRSSGADKRRITICCGGKLRELELSELAEHCRACKSSLCFVSDQGQT